MPDSCLLSYSFLGSSWDLFTRGGSDFTQTANPYLLTRTFEVQGHTGNTLGGDKPPQLVQIFSIRTLSTPITSHSPSFTCNMFMMCLLDTIQGPAAHFTVTSQTSSNSKFRKYSHQLQHRPGAHRLPSTVPVPPALPSITGILECLTSIWQFWRLPEQYCSQEYHRGFSAFSQCQIKPAVLVTALRESQVLSTLHKWTKIEEDPRVPATKLWSGSEENVVIPPTCTISEMRMCENSYKQLTATLELFIKGGECCSPSCALGATQLPNQNIFSLMSVF